MKLNNEKLLIGTAELSELLRVTDCVVFLTGGVVRDQLNDKPPRDIDIGLIGASDEDVRACRDELEQHGWELVTVFDRDDDNNYADKFPDQEDRFEAILKFESADYEYGLDLLVYTDAFENVAQAVASHDHNISQFAAFFGESGDLECHWLGDPNTFGTCTQTRPHVGAERIERVKVIAMGMGWGWASTDFVNDPTYTNKHDRVPPEWLDDL